MEKVLRWYNQHKEFGLVRRMFMVMGSVVSRVIMVMYTWVAAILVLINVVVEVFVHMG